MKKCTKCGETKELSEFYKNKNTASGVHYCCKCCNKKWREENKEDTKKNSKKHYQNNKKKIKLRSKSYNKNNKEKIKLYVKKYREDNKEKLKIKQKEYREDNKEKIKAYRKEYYQNNKEKSKRYRENNKEKINERMRKYSKDRKKTDPLFKLTCNLKTRTSLAFKNKKWIKNGGSEQLLGIDYERCKLHLERQFTKGMNWSNHGEWHIDHIIPLASAPNEIELRKLCHYTNLQPLWAFDNMSKGTTMPEVQIQLRI